MVNSERIEDLYVTHKEIMMNAIRIEARKIALDITTITRIRLFMDSRNISNDERGIIEELLQADSVSKEIGEIFANEFNSVWES